MITTKEFEEYLSRFINFEKTPHKNLLNLQQMGEYCHWFGMPQTAYPTVHVAGSKGKGSVSAMIANILKQQYKTVGLYTSPHVSDFRERITNAGSFFEEGVYARAYERIKAGFDEFLTKNPDCNLTWFEVVTMLAFVLFQQAGVDWSVFEVGMGGRLDCTNVIEPRVCVIMPIELEHQRYLGNTLGEIAYEKAGIIKPNTPVLCFEQEAEALAVIERGAREKNAPFYYVQDEVAAIESELTDVAEQNGGLETPRLQTRIEFRKKSKLGGLFERDLNLRLKMTDIIQGKNGAIAALAVKCIAPETPLEVIERGLSETWLPGRFEVLGKEPWIICDGAHTERSIKLCVQSFAQYVGEEKGVLVYASAWDKETERIAPLFRDRFSEIWITKPGDFKKSDLAKTADSFRQTYNGSQTRLFVDEDYKAVLESVYSNSKHTNKPVLITGSFYLVGEAKQIIKF